VSKRSLTRCLDLMNPPLRADSGNENHVDSENYNKNLKCTGLYEDIDICLKRDFL
jgi:phosphosulfolactate phosphohydrolase-like enzyme